ncbi:LOW QUALITY PROTEIN: uncharacterized protein [Clytia hemisphaerica]|uniref:LOW QUALITY PROTEIN: uncharacterized protein n=1 Tax=Clytia hemisphaerica TaxID=252671 RepID=UPI0034D5D998
MAATNGKRKVGFVYDEKFLLHAQPDGKDHPEVPVRVSAPYNTLKERGVLEKLHMIESRKVTVEELYQIHDKEYVSDLQKMKKGDNHFFADFDKVVLPTYHHIFDDETHFTYFNEATYETALLAAGSALQLTESVINGSVDTGFALIRPPTHNADSTKAAGFCYFNNVAIAARFAQSQGVKKIFIVDWDVHHGNGTQDAFYEENEILYLSLHRYETYPGLEKAKADRIGKGVGEGYNVNIAWGGDQKMGETEYKYAFEELVLPIAQKFQPELILVSCGFDAARGDPLGEYDVTINTYSYMTSKLLPIAKTAIYFEGGYLVENLCEGTYAVITTLLGDKVPDEITGLPSDEGKKYVAECKDFIKKYWF